MSKKKNEIRLPWLYRPKEKQKFDKIGKDPIGEKAYKEVYNTRRWRRLRAVKLKQTPYCELCASVGDVSEAVYCDHITPIRQGGDAWSMDNLQSLCSSCHAKKSVRERNAHKNKG